VLKGLGMPGHMGRDRVTAMKLKLVKGDPEQKILLIRGAIPGANRDLVLVRESRRGGKR